MGSMSGACLSFIQYRISFWRGNSWASSRSENAKSSRGGDGEAFLALVTKSVWFKVDEVSMSQSVSRLEAMVLRSGIATRCVDRTRTIITESPRYPCSLTIYHEEQEQANKISGGTSV